MTSPGTFLPFTSPHKESGPHQSSNLAEKEKLLPKDNSHLRSALRRLLREQLLFLDRSDKINVKHKLSLYQQTDNVCSIANEVETGAICSSSQEKYS